MTSKMDSTVMKQVIESNWSSLPKWIVSHPSPPETNPETIIVSVVKVVAFWPISFRRDPVSEAQFCIQLPDKIKTRPNRKSFSTAASSPRIRSRWSSCWQVGVVIINQRYQRDMMSWPTKVRRRPSTIVRRIAAETVTIECNKRWISLHSYKQALAGMKKSRNKWHYR